MPYSGLKKLPAVGRRSGICGQFSSVRRVHCSVMMVMSLPELMHFKGTTSEGEYTGTYNTKTQEVLADVEIGGHVVAGTGEAAKHGDKIVKVKGYNKDGDFKVWVDGTPAAFRDWKPKEIKR